MVSIGLSYSMETKVERSTDLYPDVIKNPVIIQINMITFSAFKLCFLDIVFSSTV